MLPLPAPTLQAMMPLDSSQALYRASASMRGGKCSCAIQRRSINQSRAAAFTGCTVLGEHIGLHRHLKHETGWKIAIVYAASASLPVASSDDRSNGTMASSVKEPLPMALFTGLPTLTANSYKSTSFVT